MASTEKGSATVASGRVQLRRIASATATRIVEWKRHEVAARQAMAKRLLEGERIQTHPNSPHVWLHLPQRCKVPADRAFHYSEPWLLYQTAGLSLPKNSLSSAGYDWYLTCLLAPFPGP